MGLREMSTLKYQAMRIARVATVLALSLFGLAACGQSVVPSSAGSAGGTSNAQTLDTQAESQQEEKRLARDGAVVQTEDPAFPTRVVENGTRIVMHFGDTEIPGILNDSTAAQELISMLPYTVRMNRYSHDYCGVMDDPLSDYTEEDVHYGWLNGDIDFAEDGNYFTILFTDEEESTRYGSQVNIGVIDCELERIAALDGSYDVRIELADEE